MADQRGARVRRRLLAVLVLIATGVIAAPVERKTREDAATPLPLASPESEGMSSARLGRLHDGIQRFIDDGKYAGAVSLLVRNGKIVEWNAFGKRDLDAGLPMEKDTIVRIYSMSKIVTSVAALALLEEARYKLDDSVGAYLPELAHMKVLTGGTAEAPLLADAKTPITIEHLLTHTSGMTYDFGTSPVDQLNREAKLWESASLDDFVKRASRLPLAHEPGERFTYGISTDVLGALIERVSGRSFPAFLQERIFDPLGMKDTGFSVPQANASRIAKIYTTGEDGKLKPTPPILVGSDPTKTVALPSGGGGLYSTAADYARFLQMLLNGGELEGVRILSRKTVELMMVNHLAPGVHPFGGSDGFGLGGSVRLELAKGATPGSVGEFGWSGAATTYARVDPKERMVLLLLLQHFPYDQHEIFWRFSTLAYSAIID